MLASMRLPFLAIPAAFSLLACSTTTVMPEPGHRALVFASPDRGGLQHDVLNPGVYSVQRGTRLEDFDVTFARRDLPVRATTRDGTPVQGRPSRWSTAPSWQSFTSSRPRRAPGTTST